MKNLRNSVTPRIHYSIFSNLHSAGVSAAENDKTEIIFNTGDRRINSVSNPLVRDEGVIDIFVLNS